MAEMAPAFDHFVRHAAQEQVHQVKAKQMPRSRLDLFWQTFGFLLLPTLSPWQACHNSRVQCGIATLSFRNIPPTSRTLPRAMPPT